MSKCTEINFSPRGANAPRGVFVLAILTVKFYRGIIKSKEKAREQIPAKAVFLDSRQAVGAVP